MGTLYYKEDKHLEFLSKVDNESLDVLVAIITKDKDGNLRDSEDLTLQDEYKKYHPEHSKYWHLIAADYQYFGGNTAANTMRSHGVLYEEILTDTCKDMKVNLPKNSSIETKEYNLLLKVFENALNKMSDDEKEELLRNLNYKASNFTDQAIMGIMRGLASYQLAVIIATIMSKQLLGHGLKLVASAGISRAIGVLGGPIAWGITAAWTAIDLAGPAKRIVIPATIYIASLRQVELNKQAFELQCPTCNESIIDNSYKFCPSCGQSL